MSVSEQINQGYAKIGEVEDVGAAYKDFHTMVMGTEIAVDDIVAATANNHQLLNTISRVRTVRIHHRGDSGGMYFRGSGILVVGNGEELLAASYTAGEAGDPCEEQHGKYQKVAVRKAGLALAFARLKIEHHSPEERYKREEAFLQGLELSTPTEPHHLGHAFAHHHGGRLLVAGASGWLPSEETASDMRTMYPDELEKGSKRGWFSPWKAAPEKPSGDQFAGYYDEVAANTLLAEFANPSTPVNLRTLSHDQILGSERNMH